MYMHQCVVLYIGIQYVDLLARCVCTCNFTVFVMVMCNGTTEHSFSVWASPVAQTIDPSSRVPSETSLNDPEKMTIEKKC